MLAKKEVCTGLAIGVCLSKSAVFHHLLLYAKNNTPFSLA